MTALENWFYKKLSELVPLVGQGIEIGSLGYNFSYAQKSGYFTPQNLNLTDDSGQKTSLFFSLGDGELTTSLSKRISKTPIVINFLSNSDTNVYTIDFYEWEPDIILYRVFLIRSENKKTVLHLSSGNPIRQHSDHLYQVENHYLSLQTNAEVLATETGPEICFKETGRSMSALICAFTKAPVELTDLSPQTIVQHLEQVEKISKKHHLLDQVDFQDPHEKNIIDEAWMFIKYFNPDGTINDALMKNVPAYASEAKWISDLCLQMGWESQYKRISRELKKQNCKFIIAPVVYSTEAAQRLQNWWDLHSLPLFSVKFFQELETDPSRYFENYRLACCFRLPWSNILLQKCGGFSRWPLFYLMVRLVETVQVYYDSKAKTVHFYPGRVHRGNSVQLRRDDLTFALTRFGSKVYTALKKAQKTVLKVDKETGIKFREGQDNHLTVFPLLPGWDADKEGVEYLNLRLEPVTVKVPLLWKKAEIVVMGTRVRWILKKNRFQFTIQPGRGAIDLGFNAETITFEAGRKVKMYIEIEGRDADYYPGLHDLSGRSYFLETGKAEKEIVFHGWLRNHYGVFCEHVNIRSGNRQQVCAIDESGLLDQMIRFQNKSDSIRFQARNIQKTFLPLQINQRSISKLLNYAPDQSKGLLVVIISDDLDEALPEISRNLYTQLGFLPPILKRTQLTKGNHFSHVLYVSHTFTEQDHENEWVRIRMNDLKGDIMESVLSVRGKNTSHFMSG